LDIFFSTVTKIQALKTQ